MIDLIAIITMLIDHIGLVFFPDILIFRIIGRLSFPLFAWGIAKGYRYTKSFKNYAIRLLLLSVISQYPYSLLLKNHNLNIGFTLLAALILIHIYNNNLKKVIKYFIIFSIIVLSQLFNFEYGLYGIFTIFIFYRYWGEDRVIYSQFIITLISIIIFRYSPTQLFASFSPILILLINLIQKKDIRLSKVFRYSFYPIHLLILFFIKNGGF